MKPTQQEEAREPEEGGRYEAQAGSSAPAAPTRESESGMRSRADMEDARSDMESGPAVQDGSSGLIQDQKWQYFAGRWDSIQAGFVDDPRRTVEQADRLVAEVIDHLSKLFKDERAKLEGQWSRSGKADTEDLRIAMQRYRDFFRTLVGR